MALLLILILIEFNPLILLNDHNISLNYVFIFEYSFFIFLNYIIYSSEKKTKLDLDLLFKYFLFFARKPSYFFNYVLNIFKKIYVYLAHFKYKSGYYLIKFTWKKYSGNMFITWRPLFKKSSYFGYYRSNRSKWIK